MKFYLIVFAVLLFACKTLSTDYMDHRKSLNTLSCDINSEQEVNATLFKLLAFDTSRVNDNVDWYYKDLGFTLYVLSAMNPDSTDFSSAIEAYESGIKVNPANSSIWWDLGICYYFQGDYRQALNAFEEYKKHSDPAYFDEQGYAEMISDCQKRLNE